jgi:hypothetical protein
MRTYVRHPERSVPLSNLRRHYLKCRILLARRVATRFGKRYVGTTAELLALYNLPPFTPWQ